MKINTLVKLARFKEILSVFVQYGFADFFSLLDLPGRRMAGRIMDTDPNETPYARIRMALDELGPTFIKFGQIMSLRSDLLPMPLIDELQKLQDSAAPVNVDLIRDVIRTNIGRPWDEVFSSFDPSPVAAASLCQVHRAVLCREKTEVALKVQRPGIENKIAADLGILGSLAARMHERIPHMRMYDLPRMVELIRQTLGRELDFSREARYMQIARGHMEGLEGIHVPRVFRDLCTPRLLVMEFVHGSNLRTIDRKMLKDPAALARNGLNATVKQLFEVGFFHADPHPGNMLIADGNIITLLDWGMVGRLTPRDRQDMLDLMVAIVEGDSRRLVDSLLAITKGSMEVDRRSLERDLIDILDAHMVASIEELRLGELVVEMTALMRKYHLRLPMDLFMMIKTLVTAEGTVQQIHPGMDVVAEIRPHLERLAANRFHPGHLWHGVRTFLFRFAAAPARLPKRISGIIEKMEKGRLRIEFEHQNLGGLQKTLERIFSRLTIGVIAASMFIGSSLIITTGLPPYWYGYPLPGLIGTLISVLIGLVLIFDILRNR